MTTGSSVLRAVDVVIDQASWRAPPSEFRHPFPRVLGQQRGPFPIHLLAMLLRMGELTTPVLNVQSGVARLWPLLRYLHAVAETPGFRFRAAWADIGTASVEGAAAARHEASRPASTNTHLVDGSRSLMICSRQRSRRTFS